MQIRLIIVLLLLSAAPASHAQATWPAKPVRLILGVPAGGTPDVVARMVTPGLSSLLGQQFVVDNRGGASGVIATELAARAVPDGYTLFFGAPGSITILPHLAKKVPYDAQRDFAPVSLVCSGPFLMVTHPSVAAKTVGELIAQAKAEPGKLNYGSAGNGAPNHLAMELINAQAGVKIVLISYKGTGQIVSDLVAGHVQIASMGFPAALPMVNAGKLRALAVTSAKRSALLPEVPTVNETGLPGYDVTSWYGVFAPAGTPEPIIARLYTELAAHFKAPEAAKRLSALGAEAAIKAPAELASFMREDIKRWAGVVKASGAKLD